MDNVKTIDFLMTKVKASAKMYIMNKNSPNQFKL